MRQNVLSERFPTSLNQEKGKSIKFVSWTFLVMEESLSYWLAGLRYSLFAYLMFICLYPFIGWFKISST